MIALTEDNSMLGYSVMAPYPNIFCFATTRRGGFSKEENYASFNCTPYTGDDAESVRRNQELLLHSMPRPAQELVIPFQTHGTKAEVIDEAYLTATPDTRTAMLQGVDALITREPGYCLCISTADCIPILLFDRRNQAIAAIHAGWRGTVNRIAVHTLHKMRALYGTRGEDVVACIGPGISLPSFEVGEEVYEAFRTNGFAMDYISEWKPETHKHHIDLWAANRMQLLDFGLPGEQIETSGICTYMKHEEFFSARRLGIKSGRILSGIMKLT
ncbi:peptidoglycan editing factor PgeF [Bacteroides sp. UBA939]|uniref:peptidoglycan editing factor PgeF n=1 Tax=Bacteroides sp. UBA939 TaxID=1946092 RepID=UPI0025C2E3C7|nr:peptidoglycan editing factor PgeF [Bacteroides sp. UBA939]